MPNTLGKQDKPSEFDNCFQIGNPKQQQQQQQHNQKVTNNYSTKLEDLLTKSCSNNTGVGAIGTLGQLVPGLMSIDNEGHTASSDSFMKSSNSNKSTGASASGSTSSSISSSMIMSNNNLINDLGNFREELENREPDLVSKHYEDDTIYGQVFLNSSSQNTYNVYQSLNSRNAQSYDRRNVRNAVSSRKPHVSIGNVPNETSV